jgi:PIN domain nuclease of toxin-antitoxin system
MAILLDSHAFFWFCRNDRRLSADAATAIQEDPDVYVSAVVAWEISAKVRLGKWEAASVVSDSLIATALEQGMRPLPITLQHAHRAGSMPGAHRDPFDRMLAAQAIVEGLTLVTADPVFRNFDVDVLW